MTILYWYAAHLRRYNARMAPWDALGRFLMLYGLYCLSSDPCLAYGQINALKMIWLSFDSQALMPNLCPAIPCLILYKYLFISIFIIYIYIYYIYLIYL